MSPSPRVTSTSRTLAPHADAPPTPPEERSVASPTAIEALLEELGPQLRLGGAPVESLQRFATGIASIDELTEGGFPRGRLSEISGPAASGRTSLALALRAGALAGAIYARGSFGESDMPTRLERRGGDDSPAAWPRTVEQLLSTRKFAEHWARKWLDVVRYADSNGNDFNATYHQAWRYRNYVIDAIGRDERAATPGRT